VGSSVRRIGLGVFFASVAVNAAIGIYAVLVPDFGDTQGKILSTSLCITGAVLLALACEPAWERRLLGPVPLVGAVLGAVAFAATVAGTWTETDSQTFLNVLGSTFTIAVACAVASLVDLGRSRARTSAQRGVLTVTLGLIALGAVGWITAIWVGLDDVGGKVMGSTWTIVFGCIAATLLTFAQLVPAHRWVLGVTLGLLTLGAAMLAVLPWLGDDPSSIYLRGMGVVLIGLAAFAVTVPVLHWIDRGALAVAEATVDAVRFCPHCGAKLAGETGVDLECGRCGREFRVTSSLDLT
jgi:hypothetical protein